MYSNIELEKQLFLLKLDLPLLKGKSRAITEYQDEGAIYQFAFDNIPDGRQVRTKTELLNEFSVRGIAFEPRPEYIAKRIPLVALK